MAHVRTIGGIFRKLGTDEAVEFIAGYVNSRARGWERTARTFEYQLDSWGQESAAIRAYNSMYESDNGGYVDMGQLSR